MERGFVCMIPTACNDIVISISGMGGLLDYETDLIQTALQTAGFTVTIETNYPLAEKIAAWHGDSMTVSQYMDRVRKNPPSTLPSVLIKVDNQPWGG